MIHRHGAWVVAGLVYMAICIFGWWLLSQVASDDHQEPM